MTDPFGVAEYASIGTSAIERDVDRGHEEAQALHPDLGEGA